MTRDVAIEELRDQLDQVMEDVRHGITVRVVEEGQSVAEIAPSNDPSTEELVWRPATGSLADFIPPPPIAAVVDVVALLREDRDAR
jgi:antitoxin (DNA-binding transcriptional repressor) of toxin-antitoxin stability system